MRILFIALLALPMAVGCNEVSRNDATVVMKNQQTLSGKGEEVGVLSDGRKVVRYRIDMGSDGILLAQPHWIYVVDNVTTLNRLVQQGKSITNEVEVTINGDAYVRAIKE